MENLKKHIINQQPVWRGCLHKKNGKNLEAPVSFVIRRLNTDDVEQMENLSAAIYGGLKKGEECFIHKHPKEYFESVFNSPDMQYIGVFVDSQLIGMSYLHICREQQTLIEEIPGCPINFFLRRPQAKVAAFGADCVLPAYRGNNLNTMMISFRIQMAKNLNCTDAASIVDRNNHWNMPPYFNNSFSMFATSTDPTDSGKIALLHCHLNQTSPRNTNQGIAIPYNRFKIIDNLLQKGFIGTAYNKENACITFVPTNRAPDWQRSIITIFKHKRGNKNV